MILICSFALLKEVGGGNMNSENNKPAACIIEWNKIPWIIIPVEVQTMDREINRGRQLWAYLTFFEIKY